MDLSLTGSVNSGAAGARGGDALFPIPVITAGLLPLPMARQIPETR
jgi:hypothetical protein